MSDTNDLKNLLERLKTEVGPLPPERGTELPAPARPPRAEPVLQKREGPYRQYKPQESRHDLPDQHVSTSWSENKETMLFGMLASLIASLGGILAGLDYLVLIGSIVFSLFAVVMILALLRSCMLFRRSAPEAQGLAERVDALSRRVEMLSSRAVSGGGPHFQPGAGAGAGRDRELEQKVEELRVLVKSLAKAVEGENK